VITGIAPGGQSDIVARSIAGPLGKRLDQPIVVENRVGANTLLAATYVVRAERTDTHCSLQGLAAPSHFQPKQCRRLVEKPLADFKCPATPYFYYVRGTLPIHSVRELLAYVRANPGKLKFWIIVLTSELSLRYSKTVRVPIQASPLQSFHTRATHRLPQPCWRAKLIWRPALPRHTWPGFAAEQFAQFFSLRQSALRFSRRTNWSRTRPRQF